MIPKNEKVEISDVSESSQEALENLSRVDLEEIDLEGALDILAPAIYAYWVGGFFKNEMGNYRPERSSSELLSKGFGFNTAKIIREGESITHLPEYRDLIPNPGYLGQYAVRYSIEELVKMEVLDSTTLEEDDETSTIDRLCNDLIAENLEGNDPEVDRLIKLMKLGNLLQREKESKEKRFADLSRINHIIESLLPDFVDRGDGVILTDENGDVRVTRDLLGEDTKIIFFEALGSNSDETLVRLMRITENHCSIVEIIRRKIGSKEYDFSRTTRYSKNLEPEISWDLKIEGDDRVDRIHCTPGVMRVDGRMPLGIQVFDPNTNNPLESESPMPITEAEMVWMRFAGLYLNERKGDIGSDHKKYWDLSRKILEETPEKGSLSHDQVDTAIQALYQEAIKDPDFTLDFDIAVEGNPVTIS